MQLPRAERIRRMLLQRAVAARLRRLPPETPYQPLPLDIHELYNPWASHRSGRRRKYGKKKAKARKHRKIVARQHAKERHR